MYSRSLVSRRIVVFLTAITAAWSAAMHVLIASTPLWHQGLVQGAVLVPTALAVLATWAAWNGRTIGVAAAALLFAAFTFVTGFSIGNAYVPAAALLLIAAAVSVLAGGWTRMPETRR